MKAYLLNIGDEVLSGQVLNSNGAYLSRELEKIGIKCERVVVVADNIEMIENELEYFEKSDAQILITTGGLGPTHDDITKEVIVKHLGLNLEKNATAAEHLNNYFHGDYPKCNEKQTLFPTNAQLLENRVGSADGALINQNDKTYVILVGPPEELRVMVEEQLLPYLINTNNVPVLSSNFLVMGKSEAEFEEYLSAFRVKYQNLKIASYSGNTGISYLIRGSSLMSAYYKQAIFEFRKLMAEYIISENGESIEEVVVKLLKAKNYRLSIAESCTGGLLTSMVVGVKGASEVFSEGFVTYSNQAKMKYLQVAEETIKKYGVVSKEVVLEMIAGLKRLNNAEVRVAISGIAGPSGGSVEKPVGLVYYAIGINEEISEAKIFSGNRKQVQRKTCLWVLYQLFLALKK
ncbi:MAG: CinA family nicotinamide mononucleotide deamidase-related protein [Bacilli bacterium]|nr:CinA family nicotinamide mononucleotide deamidase-related protein [Bacilli bacterium]